MERDDEKEPGADERMTGERGATRREQPPECRRATGMLPALPDGGLRPGDARRLEAHLAVCAGCRREAELFGGLGGLVRQASEAECSLPSGETVASWVLQEAEKRETAARSRRWPGAGAGFLAGLSVQGRLLPSRKLAFGLMLAAGVIAAGFLMLRLERRSTVRLAPRLAGKGDPHQRQGPSSPRAPSDRPRPEVARSGAAWSVARLAGAPQCGTERIRRTGQLQVGEWLETDSASRARIHVADIGQVEVQPNTRIRLVETRPDEHRLSMARGGLRAQIKAPPRLFFVETPSAVAVDLGCAYTLNVDDTGRSVLHVTSGWVALVRDGREAIVSEGARCETRPGIGLGTPYREDAPPALREALAAFDFAAGGEPALARVLAAAREPDSLTLWHLLSRASPGGRGGVYDRLTALVPAPPDVTREGALQLDRKMLNHWRAAIEEALWSAELGLPR
jgi:hypothetical protein